MGRSKGGRSKRDKIVAGPFRMRISVSASATSTRTDVQVFGGGEIDRLRFYGGPPREELKPAVRDYAGAFAQFAGRPWDPERHNEPKPHELVTLQNAAISLFGAIFRHTDESKEATVRHQLEFYFDHSELASILFDSDLVGVPLDALHYGQSGSAFDLNRFVGVRAPVLHEPVRDKNDRMVSDEALTVGLLGSSRVTSVGCRDDRSIFAVFEDLRCVCATSEETPLCDPHGVPMASADIAALFRTFGKLRSVWHVTSHMQSFSGQHFFILDHGLQVRPEHFSIRQAGASQLVGEPLVFLNICESNGPGIVETANFPNALHDMQAGGVIATHCLVFERFATEFARRFYRLAFSPVIHRGGERLMIGESLHQARLDSLRDDGSLASLCYSFHALDDFELPPAEEDDVATDQEGSLHGVA